MRAMLKRLGAVLSIVLAAGASLCVHPHLQILFGDQRVAAGWDFKVVCTAFDAAQAGQNPYLTPNIFRLPYPLLHVYLFAPLCAIGDQQLAYEVVYTIVALGSCILLWPLVPARSWDRAVLLAAVLLGFQGFYWLLKTGNVAIIELPLAALTVRLLAARRYAWAGASFGAMASLKILPLLGVFAFLLLPESRLTRARSIACAAAGFLGIQLLNAALFSRWFPSYAADIVGRLPGGGGYEAGGSDNQNTFDFVLEVTRNLGLAQPLPDFILACLGLSLGAWVAVACVRKPQRQIEMTPVAAVSLGVLVLWLFLFRQKNYAFATYIPFLLAAGYGAGRSTAYAAIFASIVVPPMLFGHILPVPLLQQYYQLLAAWSVVVVLLIGAVSESEVNKTPADQGAVTGRSSAQYREKGP
jgi:Glycosyltransferase family 87